MHKSNYYNVFCKQFDRNEHFSPLELSSAAIKINTAGLNNLGRSQLIRITQRVEGLGQRYVLSV